MIRLSISILSALFAYAAFPPWERGSMAWICLVPLMLISHTSKNLKGIYWSAGFLFWLGTLNWVHHVTAVGTLLLAAYLGLYWMFWGMLWQSWYKRFKVWSSWSNVKLAFWGAMSWVALDWVRGVLFSGFPWNRLGV